MKYCKCKMCTKKTELDYINGIKAAQRVVTKFSQNPRYNLWLVLRHAFHGAPVVRLCW